MADLNKIVEEIESLTLVEVSELVKLLEEGNVMVDENGNEGSILFGDWVIPDGYAQGAEQNLSSMLDLMGYDCISKADFIGNEDKYDQVLSIVEENIKNGAYSYSDKKVSDIYGEAKAFASGQGSVVNSSPYVPGSGAASIFGESPLDETESGKLDKNTKVEDLSSEDTSKIKDAYNKYVNAKLESATTDEDKDTAKQEAIEQVAQTFNLSKEVVEKVVK